MEAFGKPLLELEESSAKFLIEFLEITLIQITERLSDFHLSGSADKQMDKPVQ